MWIMSTPTKWQQIIAKKKLSRTLYVDVFIYLWWRRQAIRLLWFCSLITSAAVPIDRLPVWVSLFENDMGMLFRLLLCIAYMSISIGTPIYVNLLYFDIFFGPILILCAIRFHYTELSVSHLNDFQGCAEYESLLYYYTYFFFAFTLASLCLCFCVHVCCFCYSFGLHHLVLFYYSYFYCVWIIYYYIGVLVSIVVFPYVCCYYWSWYLASFAVCVCMCVDCISPHVNNIKKEPSFLFIFYGNQTIASVLSQ